MGTSHHPPETPSGSNPSLPRPHKGKGKLLLTAVLLVLLVAVGAALFYFTQKGLPAKGAANAAPSAQSEMAASLANLSPEEKQQAYQDDVQVMQNRLTRLQSYLDGFPKALTDVDALAATLTTPDAAFAFVRDRMAFEPYPGVMKGPLATLLTRGGNSIDRALLLAAILKRNGVPVKIAHGKLPPDQAQKILQQIAVEPGSLEQMSRSLAEHAPVATVTDHQKDFGKSLDEQGEKAGNDLRSAVEGNLPLLQASLKNSGLPNAAVATSRQMEILQDHFWVQATIGNQATDLDPSLKSAAVNQKLVDATETFDPDAIADELNQSMRFRLVGEFLENGSVQSNELFSKEVKATDLFGKNVRLAIAPLTRKRSETRCQAVLLVGDDRTEGKEFRLSGQSSAGAEQSSGEGGGVDTGAGKAAGGLLGGLGGDEEQAPPPKPEPKPQPTKTAGGPVLARLFLEVTSKGPHLAEAHYQRVILDRLDASKTQIQPALADDKVVRPLLIQAWDGAVSLGSTSLVYVLNTQLERLKDTQSIEQKARARAYLGESFGLNDLPGPALPAELTDYFFSSDVARFVLGKRDAPGARSYYERPRLAFFRHGFIVQDWVKPEGGLRFAEGIDLFNAPFQFVGNSDDALRLGMETGIADTALERLTVAPDRSFNTVPLFAAAAGQGVSILTITPQQGAALADVAVPPAIKNVLAGELAQGQILVLPGRLVKLGTVPTFGWWSIDPATGVALGKMELGGAQAMIEYNKMNEQMEKWEEIFTKFYGGILRCYMLALAENMGAVEKGPFGIPQPGSLDQHGAPGEDPAPEMEQLAECIIGKACEAIADIIVMIAMEPAFEKVGQQEIEQIQSLKEIVMEWAVEKASTEGAKKGLEKACEGAAGGHKE